MLIYVLCVAFFALAGLLQYIDDDLTLFWDKTCALIANLIFFLLIFIWGYSINRRIVQDSTRRLLTVASALMLTWLLLRYVKYHFFKPDDAMSRYLWYMYYIPQCLVPPLTLIAAMGLTRKSSRAMSASVYLILLPALILIVLILTNDVHQTAFSFREGFENFESEYEHGALYYVTMAWVGSAMTAAVATLFLKCSISACRQKIWIPVTVAAVCTVAGVLCFRYATRSYKVPELFIFSYIAILESCVRIGLIPSNENYEKYFSVSAVPSVITDEELRPMFRTANLAVYDREPYERAKAEGSILLNADTRLSCKKISGGSVFYAEDLRAINRLLSELSAASEALTEEGELITYENDLKERKAKTEEKNRLYSRIFDILEEPLSKLNVLTEGIDEKSADYERKMRLSCVYLAYIKRRSNLEMIASRSEEIDVNEVALSIKESLGCVKDCGITATLLCDAKGKARADICIMLYEFFNECVERGLPSLTGVIAKLTTGKGKITLRVVTTDAAGTATETGKKASALGGKLNISHEDESLYQTLSFDWGGAET